MLGETMARNRKILIYTHAMTGGGAERVCALLASGFARAGDDVILAVDFQSPDNAAYVDAAVRIVVLGQPHGKAIAALARLLKTEKPDVSLSALGISNLKHLVAAGLAGRLHRAILSYHGFFSGEPQPLSRLSYLLTPLATRLAAATICVSDSLRAALVSRFWASARRTVRIYNPVEARVADAPAQKSPPMVLAVGRLVADKNFAGLVRAFALLDNSQAQLVILGEGPERGAIAAEIARLGLGDRVKLPGYVSQPWAYYSQASCLAMSSRLETFSLVVVEALANGLPVVSTLCGGPPEILDFGRFGRLVPYDDAPAMARAIDASLAMPGDPTPRLARAREFGLAVALENYGRLFDLVCLRENAGNTAVPGDDARHDGKAAAI